MPNSYGHVDAGGLGDVVDESDARRHLLHRNPRDTVSSSSRSKGGQLKDDDELHNTQDQLAEAKMFLEAYAKELKQTRAEIRQMAHQIDGLEHERQRLKEDNQGYENEHQLLKGQNQSYENECQRLREHNQSYENELSIVRRDLEDAKNLALVRGKELVGAQVFLTKADALSISEVIEKVNNLNEEIFQGAALLGEELIHKPHDISQEEMNHALGVAQGMIGDKLINILRDQSRKEVLEANPFLVQVVLQVFLVAYCSDLVQSWSNDTTCHSYLAAVYSRVRDKEEQAVAGRWRALTRCCTRPTPEGWKEDLLRKLGSVLQVALWIIPDVQQHEAFEQKLEPIFRAVEDLRNALGEKFTSADLEVSVMEADQIFQPAHMDDAYGDPDREPAGKNASQEVVIGTTGIGLKKVMLQRSTEGRVMYENVLSAKVALESAVLEALKPQPPRARRKKKLPKPIEETLPPSPKQATGTWTSKLPTWLKGRPAVDAAAAAGVSQPSTSPKKG